MSEPILGFGVSSHGLPARGPDFPSFKRPRGNPLLPSARNIAAALFGILLLSACTHRSIALAPSLPVVPPLTKRIDPSAERGDDPGHTPHQLSLDSARALATVPTQLSLGEWRPIGPWIYAGKAYDVAVSPIDPNTVFAAFGSGGGLWKTSDGGQTWLQLTDRSDLTAVACVSVHPGLPDVVVACTGGANNPSPGRGLLYSANGGRHWDFIGPSDGLSTSFYKAILHPADPNTIYAASETGVYLTKDRGAHWSLILTFPGDNADWFDQIPDLLMKPDDPLVLIAAQDNLGIVRTADGGVTWTHVDHGMFTSTPTACCVETTSVLAWSASDTNTVYCERNNTDGQHMVTYVSTDAGITWNQAADLTFYHQDRYDMALAVDPTDQSRVVLANGYLGISTDGLKSYGGYNGYPHVDHLRVVFAPSNPTIAYDANDGGIWRSNDAGNTWSRFDVGVNTNLSFGFDINTASGQIYLSPGDYGSFQYTPAAGWNNSSEGGEWAKFYIDPNDSATVWYAAFNTLAVSHDGGTTWKTVDPDPSDGRPYRTVLRFSPTTPGTAFFLTNPKAWVTHDGGATWSNTGIQPNPSAPVLTDMIFDLAQPGAAYVSEDGGIFASTDGGLTWTENKSSVWGLPYSNRVMAPVPGVAGEFYVSSEGGIYLISNGGKKSQSLSGAPFNSVAINDLATDPAHPERVYAGTAAGLFFSQDYGQSWQRLGRNLPVTEVWQISVKGSTIYAGTDQGIWQFSSDVSWQPPPPANFAVTATSTSSVSLSWTPGSNSAGVRIFRNGVQTYVGGESNYTDLGLTPATNYCYTALDSNANGEGPLSSPICVSTASVSGGLPSIATSATSLQFVYTLGANLPDGLPVQIANGGGALSWTASSSVPWLTVSPTSGTTPATLAIEVNSAAEVFPVGTYTATVSITAPGTVSQPVSVTLNVSPAPPPPVVISDFGPNSSFSVSNDWCVTGASTLNCGPAVTRYIAAPFVPSSTFTVSQIALPLGYISGTNGAVINLMSTTGMLPGAILESWSVSSVSVGTSVSSKLNPVLQAGQTYWVEVQPLAADTSFVWYTNSLGLAGGMTNINQAGWIALNGYAGQTLPAFIVTGVTVPVSITSGGIVPANGSVNTIQPGEWVSIYGTNLASSSVTWSGNFPTSLGSTSVMINGKAAYLSYVSPTQINLQAPDDTSAGSVPVVVTTASGTATSTVTLAQFAPSLLLRDSKHVTGIIPRSNGSGAYGGGAYDIIGPTGDSLGYPTVAAKAGDTIELFAVGLGPTNPAVPAGQAFSGAAPTTNPVNLLINNVGVTPAFAGLSGAGLYQINLTVPAGLGTGDVPLVAIVGGVQTPLNVVISLQ